MNYDSEKFSLVAITSEGCLETNAILYLGYVLMLTPANLADGLDEIIDIAAVSSSIF